MCQQVKGVARTRVMASAMCSRDFQSCVPSQTHSVGEERGLVEVFAGDSVFAMGCWEGHDLQDWLSPILWAKQLQLRPDWCACANEISMSRAVQAVLWQHCCWTLATSNTLVLHVWHKSLGSKILRAFELL